MVSDQMRRRVAEKLRRGTVRHFDGVALVAGNDNVRNRVDDRADQLDVVKQIARGGLKVLIFEKQLKDLLLQ